jgi:trans-aconitate 2-methyltransferase
VGIDSHADAIARASASHRQPGLSDHPTSFHHADADTFQPDQPPDAVVFNEVLYYLPRPLKTVERYARLLAPGGVLIVSLYEQSWATRRMLRQLRSTFGTREHLVVRGSTHHAWTITAFRPEACLG